MATISSHIIVKNEIDNLPLLVDDLRKFSDEIIIVDTGSTDGTLEWLKDNEDDVLKLYEFEWVNHFAKARNFALSKVTKEWTFWCDADDRISENLINKINELKPELNTSDFKVVSVLYRYTPTFTQYRNRLFKMSSNPKWECVCHECISCDDMISAITLDDSCSINHTRDHGNPERNIAIYEKYISEGNVLNTREKLCYSREIDAQDRTEEALRIAEEVLFAPDASEILVWDAINVIMSKKWLSSPEMSNIGISIINRYEELRFLRADVYFLRSCLYGNIGDIPRMIKDCYNAINTVITGVLTYNETPEHSKILPAITIYNNIVDPLTRKVMLAIIEEYKDHEIVKNFYSSLEENNINE